MPRHRPKLPDTPLPEGVSNEYERFVTKRISRGMIKGAPYNPRAIAPSAKKALRDNLEKVGLISSLVWNVRSGNLVSGHQRLDILDNLIGTSEYKLTVNQVDLSPAEEKVQNVFMNNPAVQGTFTQAGMADLLGDEDFALGGGLEGAGFSAFDFEMEFGIRPESLLNLAQGPQASAQGKSTNTADVLDTKPESGQAAAEKAGMFQNGDPEDWKNSAAAIKLRKREFEETSSADPKNDNSYMLMLSFHDRADLNSFLTRVGLPQDCRYMNADDLHEIVSDGARWRDE